jgi:hypothetical protein
MNHTFESEDEGTHPIEDGSHKVLSGTLVPVHPHSRLTKWLLGTIIVLLVFCIIFLIFLSLDGQDCLSNPFVYGADSIENEASGALMCICSFNNHEYAPFWFNKTDLEIGHPYV